MTGGWRLRHRRRTRRRRPCARDFLARRALAWRGGAGGAARQAALADVDGGGSGHPGAGGGGCGERPDPEAVRRRGSRPIGPSCPRRRPPIPISSRSGRGKRPTIASAARNRGDAFASLCAPAASAPRSGTSPSSSSWSGWPTRRAFALTGNSTSLLARNVSALNPRLLVFPRVGDDLRRPDTMIAVGFVRGEQLVELASRDPAAATSTSTC